MSDEQDTVDDDTASSDSSWPPSDDSLLEAAITERCQRYSSDSWETESMICFGGKRRSMEDDRYQLALGLRGRTTLTGRSRCSTAAHPAVQALDPVLEEADEDTMDPGSEARQPCEQGWGEVGDGADPRRPGSATADGSSETETLAALHRDALSDFVNGGLEELR